VADLFEGMWKTVFGENEGKGRGKAKLAAGFILAANGGCELVHFQR
jgi:hypothetical protein